MKIIPAAETTCSRGQEHCILLYSEEKAGFLPNIGYIGEQLDLYLASMNIGALWFGIGKTQVRWDGLQFVIMIAIAKMPEDKFRRDMFKSKRKPLEEIWLGDHLGMANIVRFPPPPPAPATPSLGSWKAGKDGWRCTATRDPASAASCRQTG